MIRMSTTEEIATYDIVEVAMDHLLREQTRYTQRPMANCTPDQYKLAFLDICSRLRRSYMLTRPCGIVGCAHCTDPAELEAARAEIVKMHRRDFAQELKPFIEAAVIALEALSVNGRPVGMSPELHAQMSTACCELRKLLVKHKDLFKTNS